MSEAEQSLTVDRTVKQRPDYFGCVIGILVFLGGVAVLLGTFRLAYDKFSIPPDQAMKMPADKVDFNLAGQSFAGLVFQVLLLLVMSMIGSMIANYGIKLYLAGRQHIEIKRQGD